MARQALSRKSDVLARRRILVARLAIQTGVRPDQWEAILMLADSLNGDTPSLDGVALLAISSHLAAMDVRVAIGALRADVTEYQAGVTLATRNIRMHAAEGILRLAVIKVR